MSTPTYCTVCSEELEEGMRFCTSCGTPVDETDEPAAPQEPTAPAAPTIAEQVQAAADAIAPRPEPADVIIRRGTRRSPLLPPLEHHDEDDADVVVSRNWATVSRKSSTPNQVGKSRKIAGDLPDWEPLPPGEAVVTRRRPAAKRATK